MHRYDGRLIWLTYHGESVVKSLYLVKVRKGSPTTLVVLISRLGGSWLACPGISVELQQLQA